MTGRRPGGLAEIGDTGPGGGKIFYVGEFTMTDTSTTAHYLEVTPVELAGTYKFISDIFIPVEYGGPAPNDDWFNIAGTVPTLGAGRKNTALILAADPTAPAAKACKDYGAPGDWFFPSLYELSALFTNRVSAGNNFSGGYWSSYQTSASGATAIGFITGDPFGDSKSNSWKVRPIRAF